MCNLSRLSSSRRHAGIAEEEGRDGHHLRHATVNADGLPLPAKGLEEQLRRGATAGRQPDRNLDNPTMSGLEGDGEAGQVAA